MLVVFSFNNSKFSVDWEGFTLQWYHRLLERPDILHGLKISLLVGATATRDLGVAGHVARSGTGAAPVPRAPALRGLSLRSHRHARDRGRDLAADPLRAAQASRSGFTTITIAHVAFCISFVVIVVLARLKGWTSNLEEAAMILGADEITTFWKITVPQLWPGILCRGAAGLHHVVR